MTPPSLVTFAGQDFYDSTWPTSLHLCEYMCLPAKGKALLREEELTMSYTVSLYSKAEKGFNMGKTPHKNLSHH